MKENLAILECKKVINLKRPCIEIKTTCWWHRRVTFLAKGDSWCKYLAFGNVPAVVNVNQNFMLLTKLELDSFRSVSVTTHFKDKCCV